MTIKNLENKKEEIKKQYLEKERKNEEKKKQFEIQRKRNEKEREEDAKKKKEEILEIQKRNKKPNFKKRITMAITNDDDIYEEHKQNQTYYQLNSIIAKK